MASTKSPLGDAARAWDQIAALASQHGLIFQAYGGTMILIHPDTAREEGIYCHMRSVAGLGKHPGADGDEKALCACTRTGKAGMCVGDPSLLQACRP